MKQSVVMMVLLLITVLGLGKVALPFLIDSKGSGLATAENATPPDQDLKIAEQSAQAVSLIERVNVTIKKEPAKRIAVKENTVKETVSFYESWSGEWLVHELIPSVEAAEAMPLAEERKGNEQGAVKVAELREMQRQLNSREQSLDERESEAKKAETRAKDKMCELEQLETRIQDLLAQEKSIKDKKIKRLTAVYEGMKAEKAAPVIGQMKLDIVVKIFSRMSEKQVGKILSFLPPKKAVVISQALTERIGSI